MKKYSIKITSTRFGKSEGTVHKLGMSEESAKKYCDLMNNTPSYSYWAKYEMIDETN
jgi:hypothetical protein